MASETAAGLSGGTPHAWCQAVQHASGKRGAGVWGGPRRASSGWLRLRRPRTSENLRHRTREEASQTRISGRKATPSELG